jgi:hypothetical protein
MKRLLVVQTDNCQQTRIWARIWDRPYASAQNHSHHCTGMGLNRKPIKLQKACNWGAYGVGMGDLSEILHIKREPRNADQLLYTLLQVRRISSKLYGMVW